MSALIAHTVAAVMQQAPPPNGGAGNVPQPTPDPSGLPGQGAINTILNVISWAGLVVAVAAVVIGGATAALANASANGVWGSRGRLMIISGLGGALVVGLGPQLVRWTFGLT
jgi:hypothetical protein